MSKSKRSKNLKNLSDIQKQEETPPEPSLVGLSQRSQGMLNNWNAHHYQSTDVDEVISSLKQDLEGATLGLLEETLDWLRDQGFYELSLPLLEEAW